MESVGKRVDNEEIVEFYRKENKAYDKLVEAGFMPHGVGINERGILARVVIRRTDTKWNVWYFDTWQEAAEELLK